MWKFWLFGKPGLWLPWLINLFIWGLRYFQHCTWKGRGNQYIQLVKVLYCKLPTNGKQLPAFPLEVEQETEPQPQEVGGKSVTRFPWLKLVFEKNIIFSNSISENGYTIAKKKWTFISHNTQKLNI